MNKTVVKARNVCVYQSGTEILHNLDFEINKSDHTFILGPNGAGKTTLVKLLLGHLHPAFGGTFEVLGRTFGKSDIRELRRHIAVASPLLTEFYTPEQTGLELVLSGIDSAMGIFRKYTADEKKSALEQLEKFNCTHLADRNFSEMSSGEQIRVLITRALVSKPDLLILDEPSVFLDPAGREKLLSELDLLPQKYPDITMLFITQRTEDILPCFKHGILLSQGRIYDSGASEKLLTAEKLSTIFQIKMQLVAGANNRIWSICS